VKTGRPSKYPSIDLEKVETLAGYGLTEDEIADFIGISRATLAVYKGIHPEFLDVLKRGKTKADGLVTQALYKRALNGDVTACIFWLKNRQRDRWRDRHDIDHAGEVAAKVSGQVVFLMPRPDGGEGPGNEQGGPDEEEGG